MNLFDPVILTSDLHEDIILDHRGKGFHPGDFGYIVEVYREGVRYSVEFFDEDGHTIGLADVDPAQMRPASEQDLAPRRISA